MACRLNDILLRTTHRRRRAIFFWSPSPPPRHGMPTQRQSPAHNTPSSACHLLLVTIPPTPSWHADPTMISCAPHTVVGVPSSSAHHSPPRPTQRQSPAHNTPSSACHLLLVTIPPTPSWHADPTTISCVRHTTVGVPSSSAHHSPPRRGMPTRQRSPAHDTPPSACHLHLLTTPHPVMACRPDNDLLRTTDLRRRAFFICSPTPAHPSGSPRRYQPNCRNFLSGAYCNKPRSTCRLPRRVFFICSPCHSPVDTPSLPGVRTSVRSRPTAPRSRHTAVR